MVTGERDNFLLRLTDYKASKNILEQKLSEEDVILREMRTLAIHLKKEDEVVQD